MMSKTKLVWGALVLSLAFGAGGMARGPDEMLDVKQPDQPPTLARGVTPNYPHEMRVFGIEGQVLLEYVVDVNGRVATARVIRSNNPSFDRPAIEALRRWTFKPGRKNGRAVNTRVQQVIMFSLPEGHRSWEVSKTKDHDRLPPEFRWATAPQPWFSVFPVYPFEALLAGKKGHARASFIIDRQGEIIASNVHEASSEDMGRAVVAALENWTFSPAKAADGSPCFAAVNISFDFDPGGDAGVPVVGSTKEVLKLLRSHPEKIVPLDQLDRPPQPTSQHAPIYPTALRKVGQEGEALIEFFIDDGGEAQLPRIVSATAPEFGYSAAQAVATWRFEPAKHKGKTVVARVRVPLKFKLRQQP